MKKNYAKRLLLGLIIFLALGIAAYALSYLSFNRVNFLTTKEDALLKNGLWIVSFYAHISFGAICLALGGFQFVNSFRAKYVQMHRNLGKAYVVAVLISSLAGLYLSFYANAGLVAQIGFGMLAILWFSSNYKAYTAIRQRNILLHQHWMIRNYALTLAAVMLRIWLPLMLIEGLPFNEAYRIVAWLCWVPNLLVAELIIRKMNSSSRDILQSSTH